MFWEEGCLGFWLALGAAKGLKTSRSAQSVWLACNNQLTECNCANPYVAVITREINGFLPFLRGPHRGLPASPHHRKGHGEGGKAGAALLWTLCDEAERTGRPHGDCPVLV